MPACGAPGGPALIGCQQQESERKVSPVQRSLGRVILIGMTGVAVVAALTVLSARTLAGGDDIGSRQLTILFSGDDQGNIKAPCG